MCCVEGACRIIWDGEEYPLPYTKTLLIPAGCGPVEIRGNARLLMAWKALTTDSVQKKGGSL